MEIELFFLTKTITMPTRSEHQSLNLEIAELRQRAHHVEWELVTHSAAPERRVITGDKSHFCTIPCHHGVFHAPRVAGFILHSSPSVAINHSPGGGRVTPQQYPGKAVPG